MATLADSPPLVTRPRTKLGLWAGRSLSTLVTLFMLMDGVMKVSASAPAMEGTEKLGFPLSVVVPLGIVQLACTLLYVLPRTAPLGAILLTGYLGGAVATHVRVADPLFSHVLFPVYLGVFAWVGLTLRDARLARLVRAIVRGTDSL